MQRSTYTFANHHWLVITIVLAVGVSSSDLSYAGGGPERVFVVVNSRSPASLAVANLYCHLRQIPSSNVFYLPWRGSVVETDVDTFRKEILRPVVSTIKKRRLSLQIDYVVYSSDFPYAIDLKPDFPDQKRFAKGSITGLTYLASLVLRKRKEYANRQVNWYMRSPEGSTPLPTRGFRFQHVWMSDGNTQLDGEGQRYLLSTMLAYTSGRGTSVEESLQQLRQSVEADGTRPSGTIYFMRNDNIRSASRHDAFPRIAKELRELGTNAEVVDGILPREKKDVSGAMIGAKSFHWHSSGSSIVPGAICETFTSFGGVLEESGKQTPLTAWLRYGAAGSSGTVVEPYAIRHKFPHPAIHLHYARGCSLAESYYQSVYCPFQLLIVGDPLCRPWAQIPNVMVKGISPGETIAGTVALEMKADGTTNQYRFEIYVDGVKTFDVADQNAFDLDSTLIPDGYHEIGVVAIEKSPIETRAYNLIPVFLNNHGQSIECKCEPTAEVRADQKLVFSANCPGAQRIFVFQNRRIIGQIIGESGKLEFDPRILGVGPSRLFAVGLGLNNSSSSVFAAPVDLKVLPARSLAPLKISADRDWRDGLELLVGNGTVQNVGSTQGNRWLGKAGVGAGDSFYLRGYFDILKEGVYQFQISFEGDAELKVDSQVLLNREDSDLQHHYVAVSLAPGWHHLEVRGTVMGTSQWTLEFGGKGTRSLNAQVFKH